MFFQAFLMFLSPITRTLAPISYAVCCLASPTKAFGPCDLHQGNHPTTPHVPRLITSPPLVIVFHSTLDQNPSQDKVVGQKA